MRLYKQKDTLTCLNSGKYKVIDDNVLYFNKANKEWRILKPGLLPNGYSQYTLFNNKRGAFGVRVRVYKHIAIYLATNGLYPDKWEIDHLDRNPSNNMPSNLMAKTALANINNRNSVGGSISTPIRDKEIQAIKALMGTSLSQAAIARELGLNRLSVRYTMKQITDGIPLKYDHMSYL